MCARSKIPEVITGYDININQMFFPVKNMLKVSSKVDIWTLITVVHVKLHT